MKIYFLSLTEADVLRVISNLSENDKNATAIRKHCHQNNHEADSSSFTLISNASNNFHLKLKE